MSKICWLNGSAHTLELIRLPNWDFGEFDACLLHRAVQKNVRLDRRLGRFAAGKRERPWQRTKMTCPSSYLRMMPEEALRDITYAMFSIFGFAGIIIAFIAIGVYFDYDALTQAISKVFDAEGFRQRLLFYAVPLALAPVAVVLLLGLWDNSLGTQRKCQPNRDALARRAAIHRPLFGDGHPLLVR